MIVKTGKLAVRAEGWEAEDDSFDMHNLHLEVHGENHLFIHLYLEHSSDRQSLSAQLRTLDVGSVVQLQLLGEKNTVGFGCDTALLYSKSMHTDDTTQLLLSRLQGNEYTGIIKLTFEAWAAVC